MTRLRAVLLAATALAAALALPASAGGPADASVSQTDACVYVVQAGRPIGYCIRY